METISLWRDIYICVRVCGWKEGGNFLKLREINLLMSSNVALSEDV